jgi:hypothetical protein
MIDTLKEIIAYTHALGFLELVKVTGTDTTTELNSMAADKTVVLNSKFVQPVTELEGIFGLHDLGRLNTILNIPEYKENANITVTKVDVNGTSVPTGIAFSNAKKDFKNEYRFMSQEVVETQLPHRNRKKNISWDVSVQPSMNAIQRLKFQSQAAGSATGTFQARVDKRNLLLSLGDHSTHSGEFVFESGVAGSLKDPREWPLQHVQGILSLTGDKVMEISNEGAMQITVTTGQAIHQYTILARSK